MRVNLILTLCWYYTEEMLSNAINDFLTKAVGHCQSIVCFFKSQRGAHVSF